MRHTGFVVASLLLLVPLSHAESSPTDSTGILYIEIVREGSRAATFIQPRADGMVVYLTPDSAMEYVSATHVRRITDATGTDVTTRALRDRRWLGTPPPRPQWPVPAWRPYRWRAGPGSECGSFLITESMVVWDVATPRGHSDNEEQRYQGADYGYARNLSSKNSLGGSLFLAADGARTHAGLRLRMYRWLAPNVSLDVSPGIILFGNEEENSSFIFPGFSGQAGLMMGGRVGILGQLVSVRRRWTGYEDRETTAYIGMRFGGDAGLVGSAMLVIAGMNALTSREFRPIP